MRALVVSDLHSNAEALRAVMSHVRRKKFDSIVCLGDFVGYCAEPNQVVDMMRTVKAKKLYIRGNHDRVSVGLGEGAGFNPAAKEAAEWTTAHLSAPNRRFLEKLPHGPMRRDDFLLCHGSPHDEDEYVFNEFHATKIFESTDAPIVLYGHTHLPVVFWIDEKERVRGAAVRGDAQVKLERGRRYIINPGSVGQPRDRNPAACYAILDVTRAILTYIRVPYDVETAARKIRDAGLPLALSYRLAEGY